MYKEYLKSWIEKEHKEGESPMSYTEWEAKYYSEVLPNTEWNELHSIYRSLTGAAEEIESIRIKLYSNRAHRQLNKDNWQELDNILFRIQSEIQFSGENSFGSILLSECC